MLTMSHITAFSEKQKRKKKKKLTAIISKLSKYSLTRAAVSQKKKNQFVFNDVYSCDGDLSGHSLA